MTKNRKIKKAKIKIDGGGRLFFESPTIPNNLIMSIPEYTKYKMRCECRGDIIQAENIFGRQLYEVAIEKVITDPFFPDCILIISSMATKEMLIEALQRGVDLHVMYQTLQEEHLYTGVRQRV